MARESVARCSDRMEIFDSFLFLLALLLIDVRFADCMTYSVALLID